MSSMMCMADRIEGLLKAILTRIAYSVGKLLEFMVRCVHLACEVFQVL